VLKRCTEGAVPSSLIYSIADIFEDPQYRARGNIKMTESRAGAASLRHARRDPLARRGAWFGQ
jgi:crotonobetainyl-CoA:carnitine CoA-transferase CaiB-like acyl-CoA transferase